MNPDSQELPRSIRAQLHALLGAGPTTARLEALHREAQHSLGPAHEVALTVEYHLSNHRCLTLPAEDAVAIGTDLRDRVRVALPAAHPTHRAITSHLVRCLIRQGHPDSLDLAVALRHEQLRRRTYGPGADGMGAARLELGSALIERWRSGWLVPGPAQRGHDEDEDTVAARELIEFELSRRAGSHGPNHRLTWRARVLRCELLVVLAQSTHGQPAHEWALEALDSADTVARYEWERSASHTVGGLHAQLWRAEALMILGQHRDAEREARLASVLAYRYPGPEMGNALLVLARSLAGRDRRAALAAAEVALTARRAWFSADGYQVAEAHQLVDRLRRVEGRVVKAIG